MHRGTTASRERKLHVVFVVTLWVKALFAAGEIAAGVGAFFLTKSLVVKAAGLVTAEELAEDPHDLVANWLLHAAHHASFSARTFAALYLLAHGAIKLWLVAGLLRERLWYYPVSIAVFLGFIGYQLYRYAHTHAPMLVVLTVVDALVVWLSWHEWRSLRRRVRGGTRGT